MNKQEAKADAGKPRPTLVPVEAEKAIMYVREFGCMKYGDPDNWKRVEPSRYLDAALRHIMAYREDHNALDEESSLPPLWHALNDLAFIVALEWDEDFQRDKSYKSARYRGRPPRPRRAKAASIFLPKVWEYISPVEYRKRLYGVFGLRLGGP